MSRRALHGLFGSMILAGLLALGLATTYDAPAEPGKTITWVTCPPTGCR